MNPERDIIRRIEGALTRDLRVNLPANHISIHCDGGNIVLTGNVESVAVKRLTPRLAAGVAGVTAVDDRLRVIPPNPMGDLEIAEHLRHALIQERNIEELNIEIDTEPGGGVIMRGHIHSLVQKRLAEVLCWWIPGVANVEEPPHR